MSRPKSIALYNFDHGFDRPTTFRFGPYEFKISEAHVRAAAKLSCHAKHHYTSDSHGHPVVHEEPPKAGRLAQTAGVRLVAQLPAGQPFLGGPPDADGIGDLCVLLSFMTGRRVLVRSELIDFEGTYYGDKVVGRNYFNEVGNFWPDLAAIHRHGLAPALWALIQGNSTSDLIGRMCYASAALDSIVTSWIKDHAMTSGVEEKVSKARKAVSEVIRAELGESQTAMDALAKVGGLFAPSAWTKLATYLKAKGLLSSKATEDEVSRAKLLNSTRNRVVHTADVPSELHRDFLRRAEIAAYVVVITTEICAGHLAAIMGIDDFQIQRSKLEVAEFFKSGILRGHKVFEEDYASFVTRLKQTWLGSWEP